jgi:predicted nucleotidyltransferase
MLTRLYTRDDAQRARVVDQLSAELGGESDIVFAYLYGSFVDSSRFHDVDVGVYFDPIEPDQAGARALALAERFSDRVGLPVDVRVLNNAPVPFLFHVFCGQVLVSRDDERLENLIERTAQRYFDIAPVLRRSTKDAFAA